MPSPTWNSETFPAKAHKEKGLLYRSGTAVLFVSRFWVGGSSFGSNGDDRRLRRKQGGAVGAAASKTRVPPKARSGCWVPQPGAAERREAERVSPAKSEPQTLRWHHSDQEMCLSLCGSSLSASSPSPSRLTACHLSQRERQLRLTARLVLCTTSQSPAVTAPLVGEPLAKRFPCNATGNLQGFPPRQSLPY